jgi:hypothetical protein
VQVSSGTAESGDDLLLTAQHAAGDRRDQPCPAAPKGAEGIEMQVQRARVWQRLDRLPDVVEPPLPEDCERQVRQMPAMRVRSQRRYAEVLEPVP